MHLYIWWNAIYRYCIHASIFVLITVMLLFMNQNNKMPCVQYMCAYINTKCIYRIMVHDSSQLCNLILPDRKHNSSYVHGQDTLCIRHFSNQHIKLITNLWNYKKWDLLSILCNPNLLAQVRQNNLLYLTVFLYCSFV